MPFFSHLRHYLAQHELESPVFCFLDSHRPLAFVMGQLFFLLEPFLAMLGLADGRAWIRILSEQADVRLPESDFPAEKGQDEPEFQLYEKENL